MSEKKQPKYRKKCWRCKKYFDVFNQARSLCDECSNWWKASKEKEAQNEEEDKHAI